MEDNKKKQNVVIDCVLPFNRVIKISSEDYKYFDEYVYRLNNLFDCVQEALTNLVVDTNNDDIPWEIKRAICDTKLGIDNSIQLFKHKGVTVPCKFPTGLPLNHDLSELDKEPTRMNLSVDDLQRILKDNNVIHARRIDYHRDSPCGYPE